VKGFLTYKMRKLTGHSNQFEPSMVFNLPEFNCTSICQYLLPDETIKSVTEIFINIITSDI